MVIEVSGIVRAVDSEFGSRHTGAREARCRDGVLHAGVLIGAKVIIGADDDFHSSEFLAQLLCHPLNVAAVKGYGGCVSSGLMNAGSSSKTRGDTNNI